MREARGRLATIARCPIGGEAHGQPVRTDSGHWYCPHQTHDGRPHNHPDGPAPQTRSFFTDVEIHEGLKDG